MIDPDRQRFFETRDRLRALLDADRERQWVAMCERLIAAVTRSIWQE